MKANLYAGMFTLGVLLLCVASLKCEDKKPDPKPVPEAAQVKVLKSQLALKNAQAEMANLQAQWQQLQSQGTTVAQKIQAAQNALKIEIDTAAKDIGLDPAKYDFDQDKLVFSPKAEPAKPSPSPEKK